MHAYIHIHIHTNTHVFTHTYIHTYINACIHTYIHTYIVIHMNTHVFMHTYIHTYTSLIHCIQGFHTRVPTVSDRPKESVMDSSLGNTIVHSSRLTSLPVGES